MQLNKPQGFVSGGVAMQVDQARQRQSGLMNLTQADNVITNPSGMQENINIQERKPTEDVNINESIIQGQKNTAALENQKGLDSLKNNENIDPNKLDYFETTKMTASPNKSPTVKEENIDRRGLFSDSDKKGIFAGYLAVALSQPGDVITNLASGLGQAAIGLGKLKGEEAKYEAEQKKIKFQTTKEVFDNEQKKNVLRTEAEIQTEMMPNGERRYGPKQETSKRSFKLIKVFDKTTNSNRFLPENQVYDSVTSGEDRFTVAEDGFLQVKFNEDTDYGDAGDTGFAPKFAIMQNPKAYSTTKKDAETILEGMLLKDEARGNQERAKTSLNQLFKAREANDIIKTIKKDLTEKGAEGGLIGDLVQTVAGAQGFLGYFTKFEQSKNHAKQYQEIQNAIFNPEAYFNSKDVKTTREERARIRALSNKIKNNKGFAALFDPKKQVASAALRTSVVNLAYALAKAREEGGRFSVTDIEMAMRTIGDSSNKFTFLSALDRTGLELLRPAVNNYLDAQSILKPDVDVKLPKRLQYLQDDLEYYENPAKKEALRKQEFETQIEKKDDIEIPEL